MRKGYQKISLLNYPIMKKKLLKIALMFAVSLTCQEVAAQKIELKDIQGMTRKTLASIQSEMIAQDFSIANIFNDKLSATDSVVFKYGNSIYLSYKSKKKTRSEERRVGKE